MANMMTATGAVNGVTKAPETTEIFSSEDLETIDLQESELEELESGAEADLENISFEDVSEGLMEYFEGGIEEGLERSRSGRGSRISKRIAKVLFRAIKKVVVKIISNARTRIKLFNACKQGPDAVVKILLPVLRRVLKATPFTFLVDAYGPALIRRLYRPICRLVARQAGMKTEDVEAVSEAAPIDFF